MEEQFNSIEATSRRKDEPIPISVQTACTVSIENGANAQLSPIEIIHTKQASE